MTRWVLTLLSALWGMTTSAGEVTVAVASNFLTTAEQIATKFEAETGHRMALSHGSTGLLYAQIEAGAPFDIFLAADAERPRQLLRKGKATNTGTYAIGQLALISQIPVTRETIVDDFAGRTVALADPIVAPYGKASTKALERLRLDTATFQPILVSNVGQVATVFATGNADLAFVGVAQLPLLNPAQVLDLDGIAPQIRQDAALLVEDNPAANALWSWLFSPESKALIAASGYGTP